MPISIACAVPNGLVSLEKSLGLIACIVPGVIAMTYWAVATPALLMEGLGVGDAMIFTSLLRLVALWFRVKQAPMVTQVTGVLGQLGAIAAASPLAYALKQWGWTTSFTVAASVGVVLSVLLFFVVKDSPYTGDSIERIKVRALARTLAEVWDNPGTRDPPLHRREL